jgi:hypothetical protein
VSAIVVGFDLHNWNHKRHGGPRKNGVNRRGELCLGTTRRLVDFANEHDAHLVVAGDLVDDPGPVHPQFAARLRNELARCCGGVSLVLGNHDMTADGDHSLDIYTTPREFPGVQVCDQTSWLCDQSFYPRPIEPHCGLKDNAIFVPFHRDIRSERVCDVPLLIGHFGVFDDSFPPWAQRSKGAWHVDRLFEFMKERNVRVCMLGDWHARRIWRTHNKQIGDCGSTPSSTSTMNNLVLMQGGALTPTGWDNPGLHGYGTAALWNGERLSWQELSGPRFCVARSDAEEKSVVDEARQLGHNLFLRRYYEGKDKPEAPEGVEAYEALPVKIERAASVCLEQVKLPQDRMQQLVSDWLESAGDDREALGVLIKEYI